MGYVTDPVHWTASNPEEHYGLEYDTPDNRPREGATFHQAEEVAGMYADLHGRFQYIDHQVAVWAGTAYYPLLRGLVTVRIPEGGTIRLEETEDGTRMSHAVWMDFPNNRRGRALKWVFTTALGGKAKLYDHTNRELVFFKDRIESAAPEKSKPLGGEFVAESVYQPNRVHRHLTPADEVTFHTVTPSMGGQFKSHVTVGQGMNEPSPFDAIREFEFDGTSYQMANLTVLEEGVSVNSTSSPSVSAFSLESVLRNVDGETITVEDVRNVASWQPDVPDVELPFTHRRGSFSRISPVSPRSSTSQRSGLRPTEKARIPPSSNQMYRVTS